MTSATTSALRASLVLGLLLAGCGAEKPPEMPSVAGARYSCSDSDIRDAIMMSLKRRDHTTHWTSDSEAVTHWYTTRIDGRASMIGNSFGDYDSGRLRVRYRVRVAGPAGERGFVIEAELRQKKQNRVAKIRRQDHPAWLRHRVDAIRRDTERRLADCAVEK